MNTCLLLSTYNLPKANASQSKYYINLSASFFVCTCNEFDPQQTDKLTGCCWFSWCILFTHTASRRLKGMKAKRLLSYFEILRLCWRMWQCCEDNRYDRKIVTMYLCHITGVDHSKPDSCWLRFEIWLVNQVWC